jgi:hypothetical protein
MKIPKLSVAKWDDLGSLERLRLYLVKERAVEGADRVERAIITLKHINRIRVGSQHAKAQGEAAAAYGSLGIVFPPLDWATAWGTIQSRATEALDAIREEVQALTPRT